MSKCYLEDSRVNDEIRRLYEAAEGDRERWAERKRQNIDEGDALVRLGEMYIPVSPDEGRLLYFLARSSGASSILEFGASFGISTLHLGAAAQDNGGSMITTEAHPGKCEATRQSLARTGLDKIVTVYEGDALETLRNSPASIDFLFLDGWKNLYLPLLEMLLPRLAPRAIVAADNVNHAGTKAYFEFVNTNPSWFTQRFDDMAVSLYLGG